MIDLSLTQIDPATLAELPDDVRQELLRSLAAPKPGAQRAAAANAAAAAAAQEQAEPDKAAEEVVRLHVADVEAADAPPSPSGPLLRDSRGLDPARWAKLSDLFPPDLLDDLLQSSAVKGWSVIEDWLDEVVFSGNDVPNQDVHVVRPEQVDAAQQLLVVWATSCAVDDLEGARVVLRKQQQLTERRPSVAAACAACAAAVQAVVREHYGAALRA